MPVIRKLIKGRLGDLRVGQAQPATRFPIGGVRSALRIQSCPTKISRKGVVWSFPRAEPVPAAARLFSRPASRLL